MSKPHIHANSSAKIFGGKPEDYMKIHEMMDSSKAVEPSYRHRMVFHNAFGIYIIQQIFGYTFTNSDGREVAVRDVAEQHVIEDLGFIPTLNKWLESMPVEKWMSKPQTITKKEFNIFKETQKPVEPFETPKEYKRYIEDLEVKD